MTSLKRVSGCISLLALAVGFTGFAQATGVTAPSAAPLEAQSSAAQAPVDYSQAANWVCRPGKEDICTTSLDVDVVQPSGKQTAEHVQPVTDPPIDCFYVYPTVSREPRDYADMTLSPEVEHVTRAQGAELSSRCRVFAPIYRQATLHLIMRTDGKVPTIDWTGPARDVAAALRYYFEHDNHGRGVVLIGHSQGSILLQAVMAHGMDGKPAQARLVAAFLAGDPSLGVPAGKLVGGTFQHIPMCSAAAQTGCVYAWGTYLQDDATPSQMFGAVRPDGLVSACASPAAPTGVEGALKPILPRNPALPAGDAPYVELLGAFTGSCQLRPSGSGFRIHVTAGPQATLYHELLEHAVISPGWGLHVLDVNLVAGNILDVLAAETATWTSQHRPEDDLTHILAAPGRRD
jgi:hypothetical protein